MIIIEANEIPKSVFEWYAQNSNGLLSKTINKFGIVDTILDDVDEKYLYPSQAWASISTGLSSDLHKIRWYNDAKSNSEFYWRDLAKKNKKVALMNVLHTGSISKNEEKNYDFIFPDFFCLEPEVTLKKYKNFQIFNHNMSVSSGRKTSKKTLLFNAIKSFIVYPSPSAWGLSLKDSSKWFKITFSAVRDSEVLRNAQFILQQRIFLDVIKTLGKDISVFFTNHVASCLHRNFHDLNSDFENDKVRKSKIFQSMNLLEDFLQEIQDIQPRREIILISAMGQKLNTKVNKKYKLENKKDYKLIDYYKFLEYFGVNTKKVEVLYEMIPQYTFQFRDKTELESFVKTINKVGSDPEAMRFGYYVPSGSKSQNTKGFFCHLDLMDDKVTCTMSVRPNNKGHIILNNKEVNFEDLGYTALNVNDFHHGEHSKYGCIIAFKEKLFRKEKHFTEIKKFILSKI